MRNLVLKQLTHIVAFICISVIHIKIQSHCINIFDITTNMTYNDVTKCMKQHSY